MLKALLECRSRLEDTGAEHIKAVVELRTNHDRELGEVVRRCRELLAEPRRRAALLATGWVEAGLPPAKTSGRGQPARAQSFPRCRTVRSTSFRRGVSRGCACCRCRGRPD